MDSAIKTKWIEALRSGKYTQAMSGLRNCNDGYCWLGVLCDILDPNAWSRQPWSSHYEFGRGNNRNAGTLPTYIKWDTGISSDTEAQLVEMNDIEKLSFNQIADYIEKNL